jgi:hypothetical protein
MASLKNELKNIIIPLIGIIVIVVGYFFIDFNSLYQSFKGKAQFIIQDTQCNLHTSSCSVTLQDGTSFQLTIEPKTIPLMEPLKFVIKSNNPNLKRLKLNIYATNMFMGDFNLPLKNLGNGTYEATSTLPTCQVGNMKWNADIRIEKFHKTIGARFQFKTDR